MSGCFISSAQAKPTTISSGLTMPPSVWIDFGRAASSCAAYRISANLRISEGWNWSGPAPSQRVAPFTVTPMPGTITASVRPNPASTTSGVSALSWRRSCCEMKCSATSPTAPSIR